MASPALRFLALLAHAYESSALFALVERSPEKLALLLFSRTIQSASLSSGGFLPYDPHDFLLKMITSGSQEAAPDILQWIC
jgi:hypothetical protein